MYRKANKAKYENLVKNSQQITTALDIHQTLRDLTCLSRDEASDNSNLRSISLMKEIPSNRTCESVGISMHYCVCELDWKSVDKNDEISIKATEFVINYINRLLSSAIEFCHRLNLIETIFVKLAKFKLVNYVKISFKTGPNNGMYEALFEYQIIGNSSYRFGISSPASISRTNPYGNQPRCLDHVPPDRNFTIDLRNFVFVQLAKCQI